MVYTLHIFEIYLIARINCGRNPHQQQQIFRLESSNAAKYPFIEKRHIEWNEKIVTYLTNQIQWRYKDAMHFSV